MGISDGSPQFVPAGLRREGFTEPMSSETGVNERIQATAGVTTAVRRNNDWSHRRRKKGSTLLTILRQLCVFDQRNGSTLSGFLFSVFPPAIFPLIFSSTRSADQYDWTLQF